MTDEQPNPILDAIESGDMSHAVLLLREALADAERDRDEARRELCEHLSVPSLGNPDGADERQQANLRGWGYLYPDSPSSDEGAEQ